ncbi:MAG: nuclear transport factor 2 family protein [Gammaproteobacteria bacterium]|nr:nuclear transport factor 2 family protein [Gammaproteobacteria bacterium]
MNRSNKSHGHTFAAAALLILAQSVPYVAANAAGANDAAVAQRLLELDGESQIRWKLQRYMELLTAREWDEYIELFAEDAEIDIVEGVLHGRDAIKQRMATASERMTKAQAGKLQRKRADLLTNVMVDVDGDSATVSSRFVFIAEDGAGGFQITGSGRYLDTWQRYGDQWLIQYRKVDYDLLAGAN